MKKLYVLLVASFTLFLFWCATKPAVQDVDTTTAKDEIYSQTESESYVFAIEKPESRFENPQAYVVDNLNRIDFSKEQLEKLLDSNQWVVLHVYTKYDPAGYEWFMPTIQARLLKSPTSDLNKFEKDLEQSIESMRQIFDNFEITQKLEPTTIAQKNAVSFVSEVDLVTPSWEVQRIRGWTYAIPFDGFFYQINFSDIPAKEDVSELFQNVLESISFE